MIKAFIREISLLSIGGFILFAAACSNDEPAKQPQAPSNADTTSTQPVVENKSTTRQDPKTAALALAKKSGCLTCHRLDKKVVGPPWNEVAKRYKGDKTARDFLVEKVKKGGKGNWTKITRGAAMPPYYPRVRQEDIETLVEFILSLEP